MTTATALRIWAHACLLASGVLVLAGALASAVGLGTWMTSMMEHAGPKLFASAIALWMGLWGLVTGALLVIAAVRVRGAGREERARWGTVAIVVGALSLLGAGGWLLGAALGVLGGILAIASAGHEAPP
jgi:hypothetical protein